MHPSRATLATTGLLLSLLASCSEQTVVPTEPSRVATMPSIPGSSSVTVRTGQEAEQFLDATAAAWDRRGDTRLSQDIAAQRALTVRPDRVGSRAAGDAQYQPSISPSATEMTPSPTTTPDAIIYYSSTVPYVNGRSALIVSSVTYFGNIAISVVSYEAKDASGNVVIPPSSQANRGLGQRADCIGSTWLCSWTFKLRTVISLDLGKDCGITLWASANHTAQWTTPAAYKLPAAIWGSTYSADSRASATNGPCTPATTCRETGATNYGGALPCTYPAPGGGDGSTPPPSGGTTQPPTYQPGPYVPSGHWECVIYFMGTDYQKEYCTWYADYARVPKSSPAFSLSAGTPTTATQASADLPSVFVIVSDQVPPDAIAVIERHMQGPYKNVLLVPSSTIRPAVLVAALQALADSRGARGETPAKDLQLTLKGGVLDPQIPAVARDYASSFTAMIANARRGDAGPYGQRPILEIRLGDRK